MSLAVHAKRLRDDFETFSRFLMVRPEEGGRVVPFRMMPGQRKVMAAVGNHRRVLILKGRRLGITTLYLARAMHLIGTRPYTSALMTAHRNEDSTKIFKNANIMYRGLPDWLKHERTRAQRREVDYPLMGSNLGIGTAGGQGAGRSDTLHFVHMTEASRYPGDQEDFISGILEAARRGVVTAETTAAGASGWFYETWKKSKKDGGPWHCVFAPWWWDHRNVVPLAPKQLRGFKLSEDERAWAEPNELTPHQVMWYRYKALELGKKIRSEYPCSDIEAFIATGLHFFNQANVAKKSLLARPPLKLKRSQIPEVLRPLGTDLQVWQLPGKGKAEKSVFGGDPTDGTEHGSYAYGSMHRRDGWMQQARIRRRCGPGEFAKYVRGICVWYNRALAAIELNRRECVRALVRDERYSNVYYQRRLDGSRRKEPGFWTDAASRNMALDYLREAFEGGAEDEGILHIHDPIIFQEMTTFVDQGGGRYAAGSGEEETDDGILAIAIALQALQTRQPTLRYM